MKETLGPDGIKVVRAESDFDLQVRVSGLKDDLGDGVSFTSSVTADGDVVLSLTEKGKGTINFQLCTQRGGSRNSQLTKVFRDFVRNLADEIEKIS